MNEQIVYRTDELENAIDYLEQAANFFENVENPHRFKWLMISLHGALYGFGVCAIKGSRSFHNVIKDIDMNAKKVKAKKAELESLFSEFDFDLDSMLALNVSQLISIWTVLDRCKSEDYMQRFVHSKVLQTTSQQNHAIKKLIEYRNQLAHFKPSAYGITGNYEKDIIMPVVDVISFLALESNNINYYNDESKMRVEKALHIFKIELKKLT
ncbi:hypothetical protein [Priestia megaterium]|uniref:hypothetical protein n=1 Tax=Priestia megaterium TaxID=1404 RepID=UPI000BFCB8C0|nr:hypothetical protein [Priestia megaterium]PGY51506.1 hypothetical protein COE35_13525 [Priestia megaterium]